MNINIIDLDASPVPQHRNLQLVQVVTCETRRCTAVALLLLSRLPLEEARGLVAVPRPQRPDLVHTVEERLHGIEGPLT